MMPNFSFIHPGAFWLLLLLVPIWVLAFVTPRRLSPTRFWWSLGLRTLMVVALILSLAGTQIVRGVDQVTTVFLLDSSDSVSPSARSQAEVFVQDALETKQENDLSAVIVFGENALVERAPDERAVLGRLASEPLAARTNIEEAIQLGLALFPSDSQKRLVLLSDGGENSGSALDAARFAATRGIPIEVVDLSMPDTNTEALVADLQAPDRVREGQEIDLAVTVESSVAQVATLRIFDNQEVVVDREVELVAGSQEFHFQVTADGQGFRRYRVQIEPAQDNRVQNNESATLVQVEGPPRVLLVEGEPGEAAPLQNALQAANVNAERVEPASVPTTLTGLSTYEAVVLVNVPARDLPVQTIGTLPTYVRDLGRGLVMIGGNRSYGVGGYGDTPIEEVLPVYMDVRNREERPDLALIFVIDKSGSMDACHCAGPNRNSAPLNQSGERKIDIAKEAITQASALLGEQDTLGIVGFDSSADWVMPTTQGITSADVAEAVATMAPRGDTNVRSGLRAAEDALHNIDARIKHIVLLTDGWGEGGNNLDIAQRMNDAGITLSVVAAGSGSATFLENLAHTGGGRYYASEDMSDVPEIFLQETIVAAGNYIVERPFFPLIAADSPILHDLEDGLPALYGYNGSTIKDTARAVLVADDESPVLAQWQYGLGRSVAWTSDTKGQWANDWVQWAQFPRFASQMIAWVLPTNTNEQIATDIQVEDGQTTITALLGENEQLAGEQVELSATLIPGNPDDEETAATLPELELTQVSPGEYHASIPNPSPGTYFVQIHGEQNGRTVVQHIAGLVVPYSAEYRQDQSNPALLANLMELTNGNTLDEPAQAFERNLSYVTRAQEIALALLLLALLLLPFDIAIRRLMLHRSDMRAVRAHMFGWAGGMRSPRRASDSSQEVRMTRLAQAKNRATAHTTGQSVPTRAREQSPVNDIPPAEHSASAPPPVTPTPRSTPEKTAPPASPRPGEPAEQDEADPLERLRAAKERARRRARGEE